MITAEQLAEINKELESIPIRGKDYVQVNKRVMAFRKLVPEWSIETDIISNEGGVVVMKAVIKDETERTIATGLSYEKEANGYINKTSYIENCETSAVGRALGFLGIGIDSSMASAEEVANAIKQQDDIKKEEAARNEALIEKTGNLKIEPAKVLVLKDDIQNGTCDEAKMLKYFKVEKLEDVTEAQFLKYVEQRNANQAEKAKK